MYQLASGLLKIGTSTAADGLFRSLKASSDPELRFVGLAGLARANDPSALAEIANSVDSTANLFTRSLVSGALCGRRDTDARAIQALGIIATAPNSGLQGCAAQALEYIHTRDTLPYLAQLLDSGDQAVREAGMRGLSRFVDNLPVQTVYTGANGGALTPQGPAPLRTPDTDRFSLSRRLLGADPEGPYLQFWKGWWATMKDQITPP